MTALLLFQDAVVLDNKFVKQRPRVHELHNFISKSVLMALSSVTYPFLALHDK